MGRGVVASGAAAGAVVIEAEAALAEEGGAGSAREGVLVADEVEAIEAAEDEAGLVVVAEVIVVVAEAASLGRPPSLDGWFLRCVCCQPCCQRQHGACTVQERMSQLCVIVHSLELCMHTRNLRLTQSPAALSASDNRISLLTHELTAGS